MAAMSQRKRCACSLWSAEAAFAYSNITQVSTPVTGYRISIHLNIRLAILATTGRFLGFFFSAAPLPLSSLSRLLLDLPNRDGGSLWHHTWHTWLGKELALTE